MLDLIEFENLPVGETRQSECFSCGKRKFYVTRKRDGLAFICFRASCPTQGFVSSSGLPSSAATSSYPQVKTYTGSIGFITPQDVAYFQERFGLEIDSPHDAADWIKLTEDGRYVLPIWGERDQYKGIVVRRPLWGGEPAPVRTDRCHDGMPKSLTYLEKDASSRLAWAHSTDESTVVIVEDQVSAMRIASEGITGVALLGTSMGAKEVVELLRFKNAKRFILALDPDAIAKALKLAQQYQGVLRSLSVAILSRDPKDYSADGHGSSNLLEDLRI